MCKFRLIRLKSLLLVFSPAILLCFRKPLAAHTGKIFTFTSIDKWARFLRKPFLLWAPEPVFKRFVAPLLSQEFTLSSSVAYFPVLYGKLPDGHIAPPRP